MQTDEVVKPKAQYNSRNSSGDGWGRSRTFGGGNSPLLSVNDGIPGSPTSKYGGKVTSMKSGVMKSPYGSIKMSSPTVPTMDDIASYRSPGLRSMKRSVSMPGSPIEGIDKSAMSTSDVGGATMQFLESKMPEAEPGQGLASKGGGDDGFVRRMSMPEEEASQTDSSTPNSPVIHRGVSPMMVPIVSSLARTKPKISSGYTEFEEADGFAKIRSLLEAAPQHLSDLVERIVADPSFSSISPEVREVILAIFLCLRAFHALDWS